MIKPAEKGDSKSPKDIQKKRLVSLFGKCDAHQDEAFFKECAEYNSIPSLVIVSMLLLMESIMVLIYIMNLFLKNGDFYPQYIYMYVSAVILSFGLLICMRLLKKEPKKLMRIYTAILLFMGVWSALFSGFDVINGFSSYLFIQIIIINSAAIRIPPFRHCMINIFSFFIYLILILHGKLGFTSLFAEIVNPGFMIIAACVVVLFNYKTRYKSFLNKQLIKEQNDKLAFYANNDFLTKIPNRKSIMEYLGVLFEDQAGTIACMMVDIDNFKLYNDAYGHISGDECLIKLSEAMNEYVRRQGGRIGRLGGEEFLVVLGDRDKENVLSIANGLSEMVRNEKVDFPVNGIVPYVTISIGVYIPEEKGSADFSEWLRLADSALYKAKSRGKNQVFLYGQDRDI